MYAKKWNRMVSLCLLIALCAAVLAGCGGNQGADGTTATETAGKTAYTVEVRTRSGMALSDVTVYVYADSTLEDMVWGAETDADGVVSFTLETSESYTLVLKNCPEGYLSQESYALTGENTSIVLDSAVISDTDLTGVTYQLGSVIRDFTVTTPEGVSYTLSELLTQKKAVVLNFWYTGCVPCQMEFPYLQTAYDNYSDQIELLAINPVEADDAVIAAFRSDMKLTLPMAQGDAKWQEALNLVYPTTVVVDRYGVISLIHKGTVPSAETFEAVFAHFTADDYEQVLFDNMDSFTANVPVDPTDPATEPTDPTETVTDPVETTVPVTEPHAEETKPVVTQPVATEPPATKPTVTEPPATKPMATEPPATKPAATEPPATKPVATEPPATNPPATEPPATNPPATNPPATEPAKGIPYNADAPIDIGGKLQFDAPVKAGYFVYYNVYRVSGTYLRIESENVYVTYKGTTYYPQNGVVTFPVSSDSPNLPIKLEIGNSGASDATFRVNFGYPEGHMMNPGTLTMGSFSVNVAAGNEQGMFYQYNPTSACKLTLTLNSISGCNEGMIVVTITDASGVPRQESVQGAAGASLTVDLNGGDSVSVNIFGVANNYSHPACSLKVTASVQ